MRLARGGASDREEAVGLLDDALETARELGMRRLEERAAELRSALPARGATIAEAEIRRTGGGWTISWEGVSFVLPDSKGLAYLAHLLARPGTELHVADLVVAVEGTPVDGGPSRADLGHAGEILDAKARTEYRERLTDLEGELEQATARSDTGRVDRLSVEIEFLKSELSAAYGLGGRARRGGDVTERVRKAVGNRIRATIAQIDEHSPRLAEHLTRSLRTGRFCCYEPPEPIRWRS